MRSWLLCLLGSWGLARAHGQDLAQTQAPFGYMAITLNGQAGTSYTLEASMDPSRMGNWSALTNLVLSGDAGTYKDYFSTANFSRFYRVSGPVGSSLSIARNPMYAGLVFIPAGSFTMGSPATEKERDPREVVRFVTLTKDFYMGRFPVTQGEFFGVMGFNPSFFKTSDAVGNPIQPDLSRPVEQVNWFQAMDYCAKLTGMDQSAHRIPPGWRYRLPTEAEQEYASRAGTSTPFYYGPDLRSGMANFDGRSEYVGGVGTVKNPEGIFLRRTTSAGQYAPNAFGLYDTLGNIQEWCFDWIVDPRPGNLVDPKGSTTGSYRAYKGGYWGTNGSETRVSNRGYREPLVQVNVLGMRVVLVQE